MTSAAAQGSQIRFSQTGNGGGVGLLEPAAAWRISEQPAPHVSSRGKGGDPVRILTPPLQAQHFGKRCVVAVSPGPGRLDERVRRRQGRQDSRGLLGAGRFNGRFGADPVQDGPVQQNVADLRRPGAEQLVHQLTGQRDVLRSKLLEELVRVRMSVQADRSQAEPSGQALCPPDQAFQLACRQRAAMPGQ